MQIAPGVHIDTATHPFDAATRRSGAEYALPVATALGARIGGGAIIRPGVTIGENCVAGAGSAVVKSLPANALAAENPAGNPCRVIRAI